MEVQPYLLKFEQYNDLLKLVAEGQSAHLPLSLLLLALDQMFQKSLL